MTLASGSTCCVQIAIHVVSKGIITQLGFELDKEFYEGTIEPLLGIMFVVVCGAARFTAERKIVVRGGVCSIGCVDQVKIVKIFRCNFGLERSDYYQEREVRSETYKFYIHLIFMRRYRHTREHIRFKRGKTLHDILG